MSDTFAGITINNVELSKFIKIEEEKTKSNEIKEIYKLDTYQHSRYFKPICKKIKVVIEPSPVKTYNKQEIEMENLVRGLAKCKTMVEKCAYVIINSTEYLTINELVDIVRKDSPEIEKTSIKTAAYFIINNVLHGNIEKKEIATQTRGKNTMSFMFKGNRPSIQLVKEMYDTIQAEKRHERILKKNNVENSDNVVPITTHTHIEKDTEQVKTEPVVSSKSDDYMTAIYNTIETLLKHNVEFTVNINIAHIT